MDDASSAPCGVGFRIDLGKDRFEHLALVYAELVPAFEQLGFQLRTIDYQADPEAVWSALADPRCAFFLAINGFGTEFGLAADERGIRSPFERAGKPVFDLMHDCPAHESMAHQVPAVFPERQLLMTDHGYLAVAGMLGHRDGRLVPSITFPRSAGPVRRRHRDRSIDVLLPIGIRSPAISSRRWDGPLDATGTLHRSIFERVTELAAADLRIDPLVELFAACREAGSPLDVTTPQGRMLLTTTVDFVKFERRRRLVRAIAHLPVTIVPDRAWDEPLPAGARLRFEPQRSASEVLAMMGDARSVICPLPHMTGFHERPMMAFSAGAAVVSAPNHVLDTAFVRGRDLVSYASHDHLVELLEELVMGRPADLERMAAAGHDRAMAMFPPMRFAESVVSLLR